MTMKESPIVNAELPQQEPRAQSAGVYDAAQARTDAPKKVGVYDSPERAPGSWSPLTLIFLAVGAILALLFFLGLLQWGLSA